MPKCKNNPQRTYIGNEPSPKGLGYCASGEKIGTIKKGRNNEKWITKKMPNGSKRWVKFNDFEDRYNKIYDYFMKKYYKWWYKLSTGSIIIINNNSTYKVYKSKKKTLKASIKETIEYHNEISRDPKVIAIIWSAMSIDSLGNFVRYILQSSTKQLIEKLYKMKGNGLEYFIKNYKKYFTKYELFTKKDYTLKGKMDVNEKAIVNKLNNSKVIN